MIHYLVLNLVKSVQLAVKEKVNYSLSFLSRLITNTTSQEITDKSSNLIVTTAEDDFAIITKEVDASGIIKEVDCIFDI